MRSCIGVWACVCLGLLHACGDDDDAPRSADAGVVPGPRAGRGGQGGAGASGTGGTGGTGGRRGSTIPSRAGTDGAPPGGAMQHATLRFQAKLGGERFACGQAQPGIGSTGTTVEPVDFRMFVNDIRLVDDRDDEVPITLDHRPPWQANGIGLLDFEDGTGLCADGDPGTNYVLSVLVPLGNFHAIVFSNSVPEDLNHANPVWVGPPLGLGALHWSWLAGYRFVKLELASGDAAESDAELPGGVLHVGATACSNSASDDGGVDNSNAASITCARPNRNRVRLDGYVLGESVIVAHADAVFAHSDLGSQALCHGSGAACASMLTPLGVDPDSGNALSQQMFYTLERD
ncbi:MAG: MbnP family copper-binding protein [Polyangiales bacterium]